MTNGTFRPFQDLFPTEIPSLPVMEEIIHSRSIADVYDFLQAGKPAHPLITVFRQWPETAYERGPLKFTSELYYMALKRNISGSFKYGRSSYDYQEGTMVFIGPGQVATFSSPSKIYQPHGW
ncbi:MAG: hypothetical protein AAGA85_17755, partial [Bacteroidota bacterium]